MWGINYTGVLSRCLGNREQIVLLLCYFVVLFSQVTSSSLHLGLDAIFDCGTFCAFHLKEYAHKDYISFQKKGVGETNILQQILCNSVDRFCRYGYVYNSQCLTMVAAILCTLSRDQNGNLLIYMIWFSFCP